MLHYVQQNKEMAKISTPIQACKQHPVWPIPKVSPPALAYLKGLLRRGTAAEAFCFACGGPQQNSQAEGQHMATEMFCLAPLQAKGSQAKGSNTKRPSTALWVWSPASFPEFGLKIPLHLGSDLVCEPYLLLVLIFHHLLNLSSSRYKPYLLTAAFLKR